MDKLENKALLFGKSLLGYLLALFLTTAPLFRDCFRRADFFLLYVLLSANLYGEGMGLLSATLATCGQFLLGLREESAFQMLLNGDRMVWAAQLFAVGLSAGYVRERLRLREEELQEEISYLRQRGKDLLRLNENNIRLKNAMEKQVLTQKESMGKVYSLVMELDQDTEEELLSHSVEMMKRLLETESVALYLVVSDGYANLFASTSDRAAALGESVRYRESGELYAALRNQEVYINRTMDPSLPDMASAVYADNGEIRLFFLLWDIPWEHMTLAQADALKMVSLLVQRFTDRVRRTGGSEAAERS